MTNSACLIFNPVAGKGNPVEELVAIRRILEPEINLDICPTSKEVSANQIAQAAIERGVDQIIVSGGDGTISKTVAALIGTNVPLGIIPRGTANAFARATGIPLDINTACEAILSGVPRLVDVASCNGKPMILLAGIGFEAETVERTDRNSKNTFGSLAYVMSGIEQLQNLESFEVWLEVEDKTINLPAVAVTIANAAPLTSVLAHGPSGVIPNDGLLDVTVAAPANRTAAVLAAYQLLSTSFTSTPTDREDIRHLRVERLKVTTEPPQKVVIDGDLDGTTPVEIHCIPGSLKLLVPRSSRLAQSDSEIR